MADREKPVSGEFYRHFKGNLYQIKMLAYDSENCNPVVVYQAMYPPYQCWVRELEEFMSVVDSDKYPDAGQKYRFEKVEIECLGQETIFPKEVISEKEEVSSKEVTCPEKGTATSDKKDNQTKEPASEIAMKGFLKLLDAPTFHEKRQIFVGLRQYLDKHMLSNIAVALDIALEEGTQEQQYDSILKCLETFEHYEGGRLR